MKTMKKPRAVGPKASDMPIGDYLRWLATTFGSEPLVVAELNKRAEVADELVGACEAVIGRGYCQNKSELSSQDYVSKSAIELVRAAIAKAQPAKTGK